MRFRTARLPYVFILVSTCFVPVKIPSTCFHTVHFMLPVKKTSLLLCLIVVAVSTHGCQSQSSLCGRRVKNQYGAKKKSEEREGGRHAMVFVSPTCVPLARVYLALPIFFMRLLPRLITKQKDNIKSDKQTNLSVLYWCPT